MKDSGKDATDLEELRREAVYHIGNTLLMVQVAERNLKYVAMYLNKIEDMKRANQRGLNKKAKQDSRRHTLKNFLDQVRKRTNLYPKLDELLQEFLSLRNAFIHDLRQQEGFGFANKTELEVTITFTARVYAVTEHIAHITHSLIERFSDDIGLAQDPVQQDPFLRHIQEHQREVDRMWRPHLDKLFFKPDG